MSESHKYTEHRCLEADGFRVVDATSEGLRPHDDVIWVGYGMEGRWLSPEAALQLSAAITQVVNGHLARHASRAVDEG